MDDASGVMIAWKATQFLKEMGLRAKRPIRTIGFTGEEIGIYLGPDKNSAFLKNLTYFLSFLNLGMYGSKEYARAHAPQEKEEFNFFLEADSGTFEPTGIDMTGPPEAACILKEILKYF